MRENVGSFSNKIRKILKGDIVEVFNQIFSP